MALENLDLKRPLVFFDLETTGVSVKDDRVVEICLIKISPGSSEEQKLLSRINPGMPIPETASAIHGIRDEDVQDKPSFKDLAQELFDFFQGSDIAGYNVKSFDQPFIVAEFERSGLQSPFDRETKVLDAMRIFHKMEKRDLNAAYKFYCQKDLENAHSAENDIRATIEVLDKQVANYNLQNDVTFLDDFCAYEDEKSCIDLACKFRMDKSGEAVFTFGSNKGKKVKENLGMLKWMLDKDFSPDTKDHAKRLLEQYSGSVAI